MSSTLLEQTRAAHEEIERLQRSIIDEMKRNPKTHKENVSQSHKVNNTLDRIIEASQRLENIYEDKDSSRKEEIASIGGQGPSLYSLFYDRLREIKDYHRRYPNVEVERPENLHLNEAPLSFTGEEGHGKYLDLHALYTLFVNLDDVNRVDYLTYVQNFHKFDQFPESRLYNNKHKEYVQELLDYLTSFLARTQPLLDLDHEMKPHEKEFHDKWETGAFKPTILEISTSDKTDSAASETDKAQAPTTTDTTTDTANKKKKNKKRKSKTAAEAPIQNGEKPKASDFNNPLYCRACRKLFAKESVFRGHLNGKKHVDSEAYSLKLRKEILHNEYIIEKIGELLSEQIINTKANVEKRQSLSTDERQKDLELEEEGEHIEEDDDEEEEEPVRMTIENYPIGWDGKPIPYWLYKLHGLGIEYKCEICGDTSYFGRKAFEKHFQEWRHAHGMSCLKIPNTRHFQEVTNISDAKALWVKIQADGQKIMWRPDAEEEFEDVDGHVMSRRTFEDLKRQGLV